MASREWLVASAGLPCGPQLLCGGTRDATDMRELPDGSLVSPPSVIGGVVAGLVHAGIAVALWNYWFDDLAAMLAAKPGNAVYLLVGAFLLGFVPALFYAGRRVATPALVVGGLLVVAVGWSWLAGTVRAPSGAPTPFALYLLGWVVIVAVAGIAGSLELRRRAES